MRLHTKNLPAIQSVNGLPLFDFRWPMLGVEPSRTWAGKRVMRRCSLAPAVAEVVAELAGLGERGAR